ncbi:MAG TPA: glycerophosphodiester phosphodiesterase family protein [Bdellovibrionota bacterium]|jgi:glycerophosphoryl diester phosphodiesterase
MKNKPFIIAHRGYSAKFPENTLAAFKGAIDAGAQLLELDVHLTKDGELLVTHDFVLGRCSNGKGNLDKYTSEELRRLNAGSWFDFKFRDERFPVLEQVFVAARDKASLNIEIKEETITSEAAMDAMATKVLALIKKYGTEESAVVSSFHWPVLKVMRKKNALVRLGLLNHEPHKGLRWEEAEGIGPFSYHPNHEGLSREQAREIRALGIALFPYTANNTEDFERLVDIGATGIITNEVEKLKAFLEKAAKG